MKAEHREEIETLNNRLNHEIQSNMLGVEKLLLEIGKLGAVTVEQKKVMKELATQADQLEQQLSEIVCCRIRRVPSPCPQ